MSVPASIHTPYIPTWKGDLRAQLKWAKAVYQKRTNGKKLATIRWWQNLIDGKPTAAHPYPTQNLGVNVAPQLFRKPPKVIQEPAQHNIDPSKLVGDVCPITGNDQQPKHNDHSYVFTCNFSPSLSMCGLQFSTSRVEKLTEWIWII